MNKLFPAAIAVVVVALPASAQTSSMGGGARSAGGGLGGVGGGLGGGLSGSSLGGSGILGGTGSFIGGSSLGGTTGLGALSGGSSGSFLGATSGTSSGRSGSSASQQVGSTTFLGPYYGNPLSLGIANSTANTNNTPTFGTPLYAITGTGGTGNSSYGGMAGAGGSGGSAIAATPYFSATSAGIRRAPVYATTLGYTLQTPAPAPSRVQTELQQYLASSERLPSRGNIRVDVEGPVVVLRGTVADDHERRLAEAVARLTPGVHDLRNELTVGTSARASAR